MNATRPLPTTDKDLIRLDGGTVYPANWDEMSSSAKDAYEESRARAIRRTIPVDVFIDRFRTAEAAWWFLYHQRVELETDHERETGICLVCGKDVHTGHGVFGDCDDDGETATEIGQMARKDETGVVVSTVPGTNIPMAYAVTEVHGRFSASFGPY